MNERTKILKRFWEVEYAMAQVGDTPVLVAEYNRLVKEIEKMGNVKLVKVDPVYFKSEVEK